MKNLSYSLKVYLFKKTKNILFRMFAKEILIKVNQALSDAKLFFWLDYGTLLGAVREKGFIKHDEDLDFGMFINDSEKVASILNLAGFKLFSYCRVIGGKGTIQRYIYKGVSFDIYFYEKDEETKNIYCYSFTKYDGEKYIKGKTSKVLVQKLTLPYAGFKNIHFMGEIFNIPANSVEYLTTLYGDTYMIPNPNFDVKNEVHYITYYTYDKLAGIKYTL